MKNKTKKKVIKAQLKLLKNFYYGEDLKDSSVRNFYEFVLKYIKQKLKKKLSKLEKNKFPK